MSDTPPHDKVSGALIAARDEQGIGLVPFITAGYPSKDTFLPTLKALSEAADVIEIGVPFSDPVADGVTIQRASRRAIEQGVSLAWILEQLVTQPIDTPIILMSYLNPLYVYGYTELAAAAADAGVCGFIVPDLPLEEADPLREPLASHGLGMVQLVTPTTPEQRLALLCQQSRGFVYAVTVTGVTGGGGGLPAGLGEYLGRVRAESPIPVCAGFGVRRAADVDRLRGHCDGVIVGSALVEHLESGGDPREFLSALRGS